MSKRGRPLKPLSEKTMSVAVKLKHIDYANARGFTVSGYIEYLQDSIRFLQKELELANKNNANIPDTLEAKNNFNNYNCSKVSKDV